MESFNFDPTSLLDSANPSAAINEALAPLVTIFTIFTIVSIVLMIGIFVLWIMSMIRTRKVQNAVFDIQKTLHEMNEREKAGVDRLAQTPTPPTTAVPSETAASVTR